jgi:formylglycine-generating enzyme required for sulfatase activity
MARLLLLLPAVAAAAPPAFPRTVPVRAGSFEMGVGRTPLPLAITFSSDHHCTNMTVDPTGCGKLYGDYDERVNHKVTISEPFEVGALEVTNAEYEAFDPAHRAQRGRFGFSVQDYEAAVFISWENATNYARWLTERDPAREWRLPTEAEWEYACRAGTASYYSTGDRFPGAQQRFQGLTDFPRCKVGPPGSPCDMAAKSNLDGFLRVGAFPPNAWGLHDCHGNVEEWASDWYGADYYASSPAADPTGPTEGTFKVSLPPTPYPPMLIHATYQQSTCYITDSSSTDAR